MLKKIWEHLIEFVSKPSEFEEADISKARLSETEVRKIALRVKEEEQWWMLEPREISFYKKLETGQLIWTVDFPLEAVKEHYITGTRGVIQIDDETGEVIAKGYVPR